MTINLSFEKPVRQRVLADALLIGVCITYVSFVTRKVLRENVDGLLLPIYISWFLAILATYQLTKTHYRKKLEAERNRHFADKSLLWEQASGVYSQLKGQMSENIRLRSALATAEESPPLADQDLFTTIDSPSYVRLCRAISAFPSRYPNYGERPPKLDSDVRSWLKEAGLAANDREAMVFSTILTEHFKL